MSSRPVLVSILVGLLTLFASANTSADPSPTGRSPRLLWTPAQQAVWNRMKAEYDASPANPLTLGGRLYKLAKDNAEAGNRYSDNGIWGTLMYQFTGDPKYAELAWKKISTSFLGMSGAALAGNYVRANAIDLVIFYDWLFPALSPDRRASFLAQLNEMFNQTLVVRASTQDKPIRSGDSDETVGVYFGLACLFLATQEENPTANTLWNMPSVGGLDPTAADRTTMRNAIRQYVEMADGGEWIEGGEYNVGTTLLLARGYAAVRTATQGDHFPEVAALLPRLAERQVYFTSPDLTQKIQWGDDQNPRGFVGRLFLWVQNSGVMAGLTQGTREGLAVQRLVLDLFDKYGVTGYQSAEPWGQFFYLFNPYATADSRRGKLPKSWYAPGQGVSVWQDGWGESDSQLFIHFPPGQLTVDHQVSYWGDFQLFRKGHWALTHPISYGTTQYARDANWADGVNSVIIAGLSSPPWLGSSEVPYKRVKARQGGDNFLYVSGIQGGPYLPAPYYDRPPVYLHESRRSILYLSSPGKESDTLVVHDRINAQNPSALEKFSRYPAYLQALVNSAPALKQWVIHTPSVPSLLPGRIAWTTTGNQSAQVLTLLPASQTRTVLDESVIYGEGSGSPIVASERNWQVRVVPGSASQWDTFLNVVSVSDPGYTVQGTVIQNRTDRVEGVVVQRPGQPDTVIIFDAAPGPDLPAYATRSQVEAVLDGVQWRSVGYSASWRQGARTAQLFLADLDPTMLWSARIDAGAPVPLQPGSSGLAVVTVDGAGEHSIRVDAALGGDRPQGAISAPRGVVVK